MIPRIMLRLLQSNAIFIISYQTRDACSGQADRANKKYRTTRYVRLVDSVYLGLAGSVYL